jgi:putative transposase
MNQNYKAEEVGIVVQLVEESYTSKCDHLAGEAMEHRDKYLGRRVHRGLFKSSTGVILNADVNGALGILRKANVVCEKFLNELVVDRGCVLHPFKLNY